MKREKVAGLHAVEMLLKKNPARVERLLVKQDRSDKRLQKITSLAKKRGVSIHAVDAKTLDHEAGSVRHQGVLAFCQRMEEKHESDLWQLLENLTEPAFLLVLDGVTDPHNLGACLRTADAAGVHAVIIPKDKSVGLTPAVRKVASGAAETVPLFQVTNLARTLDTLKDMGIWLTGTSDSAGQTLYETDLTGPLALVMGAEGKGLRRLTEARCDFLVAIPMFGSVESLNVSVATAICLYEAVRQRRSDSRETPPG